MFRCSPQIFTNKFGYERPVYTLGHDLMFAGPMANIVSRAGIICATRDNAAKAPRGGGVVMVSRRGL